MLFQEGLQPPPQQQQDGDLHSLHKLWACPPAKHQGPEQLAQKQQQQQQQGDGELVTVGMAEAPALPGGGTSSTMETTSTAGSMPSLLPGCKDDSELGKASDLDTMLLSALEGRDGLHTDGLHDYVAMDAEDVHTVLGTDTDWLCTPGVKSSLDDLPSSVSPASRGDNTMFSPFTLPPLSTPLSLAGKDEAGGGLLPLTSMDWLSSPTGQQQPQPQVSLASGRQDPPACAASEPQIAAAASATAPTRVGGAEGKPPVLGGSTSMPSGMGGSSTVLLSELMNSDPAATGAAPSSTTAAAARGTGPARLLNGRMFATANAEGLAAPGDALPHASSLRSGAPKLLPAASAPHGSTSRLGLPGMLPAASRPGQPARPGLSGSGFGSGIKSLLDLAARGPTAGLSANPCPPGAPPSTPSIIPSNATPALPPSRLSSSALSGLGLSQAAVSSTLAQYRGSMSSSAPPATSLATWGGGPPGSASRLNGSMPGGPGASSLAAKKPLWNALKPPSAAIPFPPASQGVAAGSTGLTPRTAALGLGGSGPGAGAGVGVGGVLHGRGPGTLAEHGFHRNPAGGNLSTVSSMGPASSMRTSSSTGNLLNTVGSVGPTSSLGGSQGCGYTSGGDTSGGEGKDPVTDRLERRRKSNRESARRMRALRAQQMDGLQVEVERLRGEKQRLDAQQAMFEKEYAAALEENALLRERLYWLHSIRQAMAFPGQQERHERQQQQPPSMCYSFEHQEQSPDAYDCDTFYGNGPMDAHFSPLPVML